MRLVRHYEACLARYGDNHRGVDWPVADDVVTRHDVMLDVIRGTRRGVSLLDFGCGAAHLHDSRPTSAAFCAPASATRPRSPGTSSSATSPTPQHQLSDAQE